jgi:ribosomal protein S18 acetylase RimI-like enzyme
MASANLDLLPEDIARKMPRYPTVPGIRLGRLAVHLEIQGKGLGTHLLLDAMARSLKNEIAWTAFIVNAKNNKAQAWYKRLGFQSFKDNKNHLYLMRQTIEALNLNQ